MSARFFPIDRARSSPTRPIDRETGPIDREAGLRCHIRDLDGYLIEVGQATGMVRHVFADPPAGTGQGSDGT